MKSFFIRLINFYQAAISPDHSQWGRLRHPHGYCRFYPSCSQYAKQSLARHGTAKAGLKICWRILRCNPYSKGGIDVP